MGTKLTPFKIHRLDEGNVLLLSTVHSGWAVVPNHVYEVLESITHLSHVDDLSYSRIGSVSDALFKAGLLSNENDDIEKWTLKRHYKPGSLILKVTGTCNIECSYCYDYDASRFKKKLDINVAKKAIKESIERNDRLDICFHGGEPFLEFDFIQQIVKWTKSNFPDAKITYNIQTNGLLINDEIIKFVKDNNISVGISWDGYDQQSGSLRPKFNGKPTNLDLLKKYKKYPDFFRSSGVLSVVSKQNISEIPSFAVWLEQEGFGTYSFIPLDTSGRGSHLSHLIPTADNWIELNESLLDIICTEGISSLKLSPIIDRLDNLILFQRKHMCMKGPCGSGNDMVVVDVEGKWRGCDTHYGDEFVIGEVQIDTLVKALKSNKNRLINKRLDYLDKESLCGSCEWRQLCGTTCPARALANNNDFYSIEKLDCQTMKVFTPYLLKVFLNENKLRDYYNYHRQDDSHH